MSTLADVQKHCQSHHNNLMNGQRNNEAKDKCWSRLFQALDEEHGPYTKREKLPLETPLGDQSEIAFQELKKLNIAPSQSIALKT